MNFQKFVEFIFLGLFTCAVYILWDMNKSIQTLNSTIAVVVERQYSQGEELKNHSQRIRDLELKKQGR
jgi:hypothetical protein